LEEISSYTRHIHRSQKTIPATNVTPHDLSSQLTLFSDRDIYTHILATSLSPGFRRLDE
jgi:hypothetical protein